MTSKSNREFSILVLANIGAAPMYGMLIVEFYCRMRA